MATKVKEERTFVLVKPDAVRKGLIGEIIKRFEQRDLKVVALEMHHATAKEMDGHYPKDKAWVRRLGENTVKSYEKYGLNLKKDFGTEDPQKIGVFVRGWLIDFMVSAPLIKIVVEGLHAIDMARKIVGKSMPYMADMGTIRGDFSVDSPALANAEKRAVSNLIHASETPDEAKHEIKHWFGDKKIFSYKRFGVDE